MLTFHSRSHLVLFPQRVSLQRNQIRYQSEALLAALWILHRYLPYAFELQYRQFNWHKIEKLGPLNAKNVLCHIINIGVKVVMRDKLCYVMWEDLNRLQLLIHSPPQVYLDARMLPPACKKRPSGWTHTHTLPFISESGLKTWHASTKIKGVFISRTDPLYLWQPINRRCLACFSRGKPWLWRLYIDPHWEAVRPVCYAFAKYTV